MNNIRVNLQTIADAAGVSKSSASLALRGDPRLAATTRAHVRAVAKDLGYAKDPVMAEVMSQLRRGQTCFRGTVASVDIPSALAAVVRSRLQAAGYHLERFSSHELSVRRLTQMMDAKGIVAIMSPNRDYGVGKALIVRTGSPGISDDLNVVGMVVADLLLAQLCGEGYRTAPTISIEPLVLDGIERPVAPSP